MFFLLVFLVLSAKLTNCEASLLLLSFPRRFLKHQFQAQLKRRTKQVQEELVSHPSTPGERNESVAT